MSLLSIQNVSKQYTATNAPALNGVSFDSERGKIVALIGVSGSGKTTLLRIVAGLETPDAGIVALDGKTLNSSSVFVSPEQRNCGLVFQDYALFPNKTVYQNIVFGKGATDDSVRLKQLIDMAGIGGLEQRFPHEISGGQQQRVALVRALATRPKLLLLDEPLSHLDSDLKDSVRTELLNLFRKTDTTTLFVSHDIEDAMAIADRMVVMRDGQTEQVGQPSEIYKRPINSHVARLFGKTNFIPASLIRGSHHVFEDKKNEGMIVPVRPHQWRIIDGAADDSNTFKGKVKSMTNQGAHLEVVLETEHLNLTLYLDPKTSIQVGTLLTVGCNLTE